jgi:phosphinothricin acetyltransferase
MQSNIHIRLLEEKNIPAILEIYKPYIVSTSFTPEFEIPPINDFILKIKNIARDYPVLVCEANKKIVGYSLANKYRGAAGHRWSVETTIYLSADFQGKKIARLLYEHLFAILKLQHYVNVFAGIVLPNNNSEAFHKKLGFTEVGVFKNGIYKLAKWHDVKWFQLHLADHLTHPPLPVPMHAIKNSRGVQGILK